jgi:hypothetical protein
VNGLIGIRRQAMLGENLTTCSSGCRWHDFSHAKVLFSVELRKSRYYSSHISETLGKQINESLKCFRLDPIANEHPSIMPPTLTLRDYLLDISAWAAASGQTSQIQIANSTPDASPVEYIISLFVTIGILAFFVAVFT